MFASSSASGMVDVVKQKNAERKVVVYTRSWCPYCTEVKALLKGLKVDFTDVDLDAIVEGDEIQDALYDITGVTTIPQVFVGGKFVGGCDDTTAKSRNGQLKILFEEADVQSSL